ncbi:MAG: 2-oxoglutarate dehydrogenase E1 component [Candidatus Nitricoxidivorans perseverans]|uniref:2-oxoglutarate dehydrogenase E1 component n=1 Tax=Candidatus Nitricoxidivorans perseverans TaxID=2975601 RepID=A0AA49FP29_9PROT|nr:MAG: 2-oxoglutarate dehydrogenase E1 component [Candidatus Nitricoxidivorans perseverans]
MERLPDNSHLFGANARFVEDIYEKYLDNPGAVDPDWRACFDGLSGASATGVADNGEKQSGVFQLVKAYRFLGNRWARLDPLKRHERPRIVELEPSHYGFTEADLDHAFHCGSFFMASDSPTLREILEALRQTYCGTIGSEFMYLSDVAQKRWLQARIEPIRATPEYLPGERRRFLERLTAAETLERYLHTRYVGQKRFSLEGGESVIVAMDCLVQAAGRMGVREIVIGMAHRGRLNMLVNILGKRPKILFEEFEGRKGDFKARPGHLSDGDVKYHMGHSSDVGTPGGPVHLTLAFNPSHLEIVNPVVEGSVYARQRHRGDRTGGEVLPVLLHGDAAVAGQGVNQEMLNFSRTRGYGTGGTVHLVINNQIGFTTSDPRDVRSSLYCTDVFKMIEAPIFHVNGDDPEAVAFVTRLAVEYRQEFRRDVVVDIVCFRKLGHNEQDEPMVTQPLMYRKIAAHPGTRRLYADRLVARGVCAEGEPDRMVADYRTALDEGHHLVDPVISSHRSRFAVDWRPHVGVRYTELCDTRVAPDELRRLAARLADIPDGFSLHPRVRKIVDDRLAMGEGRLPIDWGMAENLAYATLLSAGIGVRLSGEDSGRGTFFHRHAVLHDQNREKWDEGAWVPLQHVAEGQAPFIAIDSVLSEEAVLAFEYGYATASPDELVLWEAQFGDFANGAQVVIDQFLAAGEAKWGRGCGLTLLLPHGHEGQGAEHSSARIERFMQLSAGFNWEVCVPSNAAQVFHLLRRQMLRPQRKPLVVMTPKSLLRHKNAASSFEELSSGTFQTVIGEIDELPVKEVTRLVACAGKVFYDLLAARRERGIGHVALARVEQLYPFDDRRLAEEMRKYPRLSELVWCQEEPLNQGAWYAKHHRLAPLLGKGQSLHVVSRPASASSAVGYPALHAAQQKDVVDRAFAPLEK